MKHPRCPTSLRRKFAASLSLLVLATSLLSGCALAVGGTTCDMNVQNPHQSSGSPRYMDAKLTFTCNGAVKNAYLSIKMQKRLGNGAWVDVPNSQNSLGPFELGAGTTRELMTGGNLLCADGTYRAAGKGKGTNARGQSTSMDWYYGDPVSVTCRR